MKKLVILLGIFALFQFGFGFDLEYPENGYETFYMENLFHGSNQTYNAVVKTNRLEHSWRVNTSLKSIKGNKIKYGGEINDWASIQDKNLLKKVKKSKGILFWKKKWNSYEITPYAKRKASLINGSRVISYRFITRNGSGKINGLLATKLDAVSNVIYNLSYICSIPSKLFSSIKYINQMGDISVVHSILIYGGLILKIVIGLIMSVIMIIVGPVLGLICHPIETIHNLFSIFTYWDLILSIFKPILNIFWWNL